MSESVDWWLRCTWAMARSEPCPHCSRPLCVCAIGRDKSKRTHNWEAWCPTCDDPSIPPPLYKDIRWLAGEVLPGLREVQTTADARASEPELLVWQRAGVTIPASVLDDVASGFRMLGRARDVYGRKPGEWSLELREDGQIWAPWCPITDWRGHRTGDPLPYRESMLAESKRTRECLSCHAPLSAGMKVWRPYKPSGTVRDAGWPADAHHHACVCEPCARKEIMKGAPANDGGTVYGPLRVVGKGTTG